jgi:16S rRNA G966 N2-methylase RsmD
MKKKDLAGVTVARTFKPAAHMNRQVPPEPHTAMYVWHKYWSRKTWNVVGEFIRNYTREGDVVFDPFAGSGVVAVEAVRNKRRAIVCDLNPVASLIADLTLRPVKLVALRESFERIREKTQGRIDALYAVHCVKCGAPVTAACCVREGDTVTEVRYPGCPACGYRAELGDRPRREDADTLERLEKKRIKEWYPKQRLFYPDGEPFKEKQRFDSLDQLFTTRNLQAVAWICEAIQEEPAPLRKFMMGAFSSMVHLCTRMMPVCNPSPTNHATAFSSPGWTQHSYWAAPRFMEQNVWLKFESAVTGHQGLLNAKVETSQALPACRISQDWREVLGGKADVAVITEDCLELMKAMPDDAVDYVFTDPPYDASVQYGELSFLWNAWLGADVRYAERLVTHEIVRNERQRKPFDVYHALLRNCFLELHRLLRPGRFLTLTFHNPTFKVRNATVRAGVFAGFDYQQIHHQPLARTSPKALLQPFGSADGDFYLRFEKPAVQRGRDMEEITDERFRRIVIETCREVIAERAEPTPYTLLINYVDPKLARLGFFGTLDTGLDIKKVLEESVGREFKLVPARLGGAEGRLWWFNDPVFVKRLTDIPLSERVEQTVYRLLNERGRVTFTQVWDAVSRQFPNSLTPDSTGIADALEHYARKTGKGFWMLREDVRERLASHAEIIAVLAAIGKARGYGIWVGRNEQGTRAGGVAPDIRLGELVTARPERLDRVVNLAAVLDMDLLWIEGRKVAMAFEVEATTTMTGGLLRGSNLPAETPKIMVLPEEREKDFQRKMESPLFKDHFEDENWRLVYFDTLRQAFVKTGDNTDLDALVGVKGPGTGRLAVREPSPQLSLSL